MSLSSQLQQELPQLIGFQSSTPHVSRFVDPNGVELEIDFLHVDALSCSVAEIRLNVTSLQNADMQTLEDWANRLCGKITYLLENIGPLERDDQNKQMLIRSTPPSQLPHGAKYYEIILKAQNAGRFVLKRYESQKGTPGRVPVEMQLTHEVLLKLVDDLVATIP